MTRLLPLLLLACGAATSFECEPEVACITSHPITRCDTHYQFPVVLNGWCDSECDARSCIGAQAVRCDIEIGSVGAADWVLEDSDRCVVKR